MVLWWRVFRILSSENPFDYDLFEGIRLSEMCAGLGETVKNPLLHPAGCSSGNLSDFGIWLSRDFGVRLRRMKGYSAGTQNVSTTKS